MEVPSKRPHARHDITGNGAYFNGNEGSAAAPSAEIHKRIQPVKAAAGDGAMARPCHLQENAGK
jgi:hypothetical protein